MDPRHATTSSSVLHDQEPGPRDRPGLATTRDHQTVGWIGLRRFGAGTDHLQDLFPMVMREAVVAGDSGRDSRGHSCRPAIRPHPARGGRAGAARHSRRVLARAARGPAQPPMRRSWRGIDDGADRLASDRCRDAGHGGRTCDSAPPAGPDCGCCSYPATPRRSSKARATTRCRPGKTISAESLLAGWMQPLAPAVERGRARLGWVGDPDASGTDGSAGSWLSLDPVRRYVTLRREQPARSLAGACRRWNSGRAVLPLGATTVATGPTSPCTRVSRTVSRCASSTRQARATATDGGAGCRRMARLRPGVGPGSPTATASRAVRAGQGLRCTQQAAARPYARAITGESLGRLRFWATCGNRTASAPSTPRRTCRAAWS